MRPSVILLGVALSYASAFNSIAEEAAAAARQKMLRGERGASSHHASLDVTSLLVAEPYQLSQISLHPPSRRQIERSPNIGGLDYHARRNRVYWSDMSTGRIDAASLAGTHSSNTTFFELSPREWRPRAVAVDFANDKLYVLDTRGKKVHAIDLDSRRRSVVFEGELQAPTDMAVDPARALMFIADQTRILRLNMDGSEPTAIVSQPRYRIKALTLDSASRRVFWSDVAFHRIKSADYEGADVRVLLKNEPGQRYSVLGPAQLSYHDGSLYFYDDVYRSISVLEVAHGLARGDSSRTLYDRVNVRAIRALNSARQPRLAGSPCDGGRGCEGMCLIARRREGRLEAKCACDVGEALAEDAKSCVPLDR